MNSLLDTYEVVDLINTKMSQESIQSKNANTLEEKQMSKYLKGKFVEGLFVFISISIHKDDKLIVKSLYKIYHRLYQQKTYIQGNN